MGLGFRVRHRFSIPPDDTAVFPRSRHLELHILWVRVVKCAPMCVCVCFPCFGSGSEYIIANILVRVYFSAVFCFISWYIMVVFERLRTILPPAVAHIT